MMYTIKYLCVMVLLGWACACQRNPLSAEAAAEQSTITFSTRVEPRQIEMEEEEWSKGRPLNSLVDILPSIGMFCYVTEGLWAVDGPTAKPTKMNNVPLYSRKDGTKVHWEYEAGKEVTWQGVPYGANVAFFGYSPVATSDNGLSIITDFSDVGGATGAPVLRYTVPKEATKQPDLFVSVPHKDVMRTLNDVPLVYRRALTAIGVNVVGVKGHKVKGMYLKGVSVQGDLSLDINAIDTLKWTNLGPLATEPYRVGMRANVVVSDHIPTPIHADDGWLMMIPQQLGPEAVAVIELEGEPDRMYSLATKKQWTPGMYFQYTFYLDESTITLSPNDWFDVPAEGGYIDISLTSDGSWTAEVEGTGLSISPTEYLGTKKVRVSWAANTGPVEPGKRYGTITFTAKSSNVHYGKREFHTSQLGAGPDWIEYNGVKWAKGNLIADGASKCKIGAPTDGGLYFCFGSLIGMKGGSDGTGVGRVNDTWGYKYWNGATTLDMENEIAVCPAELLAAGGDGKPTAWAGVAEKTKIDSWYFNYALYPYNDDNTYYLPNIVSFRDFPGIVDGTYYKKGVGDPCSYYLGADWTVPSLDNWHSLCNYASGNPWEDPSLIGAEIETDVARKDNLYFASRMITIPLSGIRSNNGKFAGLNKMVNGGSPHVQYWATPVRGNINAWTLWYQWSYTKTDDVDLYAAARTAALPVRCVYTK